MDCQRAEAYLRLLAEEELRRPVWARRIRWAAELLTAIGALDEQIADRIVADFDLALVARQAFLPSAGRAASLQRRSATVRFWPAVPVSSESQASGPVPGRLVRLGQVIPLRAEPAGGEVYLLSYEQTEADPQLSLFVRSTRQADSRGQAWTAATADGGAAAPSRFPISAGSRWRSSARTTAWAAPSCTCTPLAR